jgi:hypothetical protein
MDIEIPGWLLTGTVPQWGVFVVVLLAFLRLVIPWRQQNLDTMNNICNSLRGEVRELRERLDACEERCEKRDRTILGMRKQSIAQQIGFANILMNALGKESPELRQMIKTLEGLENSLSNEEPIFLESSNGDK